MTVAATNELIVVNPYRLNANASRAGASFLNMVLLHSQPGYLQSADPHDAIGGQTAGSRGLVHKRKLESGVHYA